MITITKDMIDLDSFDGCEYGGDYFDVAAGCMHTEITVEDDEQTHAVEIYLVGDYVCMDEVQDLLKKEIFDKEEIYNEIAHQREDIEMCVVDGLHLNTNVEVVLTDDARELLMKYREQCIDSCKDNHLERIQDMIEEYAEDNIGPEDLDVMNELCEKYGAERNAEKRHVLELNVDIGGNERYVRFVVRRSTGVKRKNYVVVSCLTDKHDLTEYFDKLEEAKDAFERRADKLLLPSKLEHEVPMPATTQTGKFKL